jgi:O2-independent ubiquinone biosynthesis accessory factor UbiT
MHTTSATYPRLPRLLALPLWLVPEWVHSVAAAQILNRVFVQERQQGDLDFLQGRRVRVVLADAETAFTVTLSEGALHAASDTDTPHLTVTGTLYDYLLLVSGREDPDTLFFQRRLHTEGDTGLGVHLKNFLAAVDPASLPLGGLIHPALVQGLTLYERLR